MPEVGVYDLEVKWVDGRVPTPDRQSSIWWGSGAVCDIRLGEVEVTIYVDGVDRIINHQTGATYRNADELREVVDSEGDLSLCSGEDGFLEWVNNSWFDIYQRGEHLDMVHHEANDALVAATSYVVQEFVNLCMVENNQHPLIRGKQFVVVDSLSKV